MQNSGCGPVTLAAAMAVLVVACGISEIGEVGNLGDEVHEGVALPSRPVCCVSGFEYPPGYDWKEDSQVEEVRCSLVLFADGVPRIKLPVGDGYEISREPDMHRVIDGNLYTFYSKEGRTVMKCNGLPLFRYDGDEVLEDMSVKGEDVFTLSRRRSGGGFSYRKNGQIMLERLSGDTFGKLWEDGDRLCFAFTQPVVLPAGIQQMHYVVCDARPVRYQEEAGVGRIWDITSRDGSVSALLYFEGFGDTFMVGDEIKRWIDIPMLARMLSCEFFHADGLTGVECMYSYPDGTCGSGVWVEGSEYIRFEAGRSIQALRYSDGKLYCILNPEEDAGMIFRDGEMTRMPEGYFCMDERAIAVQDGSFYVAMSSSEGKRPVIWHDGQMDTLRFNGCVSSISFTKGGDGHSSQVSVRD